MTQTRENYSRLDRIEAILERTVSDQAELRGSMIQLTKRVDTLTDRVDTLTEQVTVLTQRVDTLTEQVTVLTQRVDNILGRMIRFEEKTDNQFSDLAQGQKETVGLLRQLVQGLNRMEQRQTEMGETQASLIAGQERQERILDYLLRRIDGQDADS